jgi:parallel beta-helix repeat protein
VLGDCSDCLIAGCTVSRMADNGIVIRDGARNMLLGCDVHTIGRRATEVIGGDRETLTPGGHVVENCRIYDFGRIDRTYTPAIQLEGVGNRVAHNLLYDCPSSAMRIEGNDHVIEYNEMHSAVRESDDQGAIDIWRNATYRGIVFRHNYFHHIGKTGTEAQVHGQAAIRFDDAISGMLVYGNVFYRCANGNFGAVQMNAGRDNVIDNNIFVDCKQGISGGWFRGGRVWRDLRDGARPRDFYMGDLYLSRYPELAHVLDEPGRNFVWRNVFADCGRVATRPGGLDLLGNGVFTDEDPGFVDAGAGDFRLKPDAKVFETAAFRPIPMAEIGLYEDEFRATWPVDAPPVAVPDWRTSAAH